MGYGEREGRSQGCFYMPSSVHVVTTGYCLLVKLRSRNASWSTFLIFGRDYSFQKQWVGVNTQKGPASWFSSLIGEGGARQREGSPMLRAPGERRHCSMG